LVWTAEALQFMHGGNQEFQRAFQLAARSDTSQTWVDSVLLPLEQEVDSVNLVSEIKLLCNQNSMQALRMEAVCTSETSVYFKVTTWR
jgi:hypothetical protein